MLALASGIGSTHFGNSAHICLAHSPHSGDATGGPKLSQSVLARRLEVEDLDGENQSSYHQKRSSAILPPSPPLRGGGAKWQSFVRKLASCWIPICIEPWYLLTYWCFKDDGSRRGVRIEVSFTGMAPSDEATIESTNACTKAVCLYVEILTDGLYPRPTDLVPNDGTAIWRAEDRGGWALRAVHSALLRRYPSFLSSFRVYMVVGQKGVLKNLVVKGGMN